MSYGAEINFKLLDYKDIYSFMVSLKKEIVKNFEKIAEDNFIFSPIFKDNELHSKLFNGTLECDWDLCHKMDSWFQTIFHYRYFELPYKDKCLLGIYGVPDACKSIFDKSIYFQNSCDQDYEREDWEGIEWFEEIYDSVYNLSDEDFLKLYKETYSWHDEEEDEEIDKDYYKKSLAYDKIWSLIEETLDNDKDIVYLSLFGYYEIYERNQFIKAVYDAAVKFENETKGKKQ